MENVLDAVLGVAEQHCGVFCGRNSGFCTPFGTVNVGGTSHPAIVTSVTLCHIWASAVVLRGMTDHSTRAKVVVIGGGYAGTVAANRLRTRADVNITLVNPRPKFVERIRLHQFAARTSDVMVDYCTLLGDGVRLVVDRAIGIDTAPRTVQLASGHALDYDYVIYAVGSTGATPASVPGAGEFAYPIAELEFAQLLRVRLDESHRDAPVTVVGAGLTGIETAAELAEQGRKITLVCGGRLGPALSGPARRSTAKWLTKHGVAVLEDAEVVEVRPEAVVLGDGVVRPSELTIWTAGFGVPELAARSGLRTDALGLSCDRFCPGIV